MEDGDGDAEALGRFKGGGGGVESLKDGWVDAVRRTWSALDLVAFLSWGVEDEGGEVEGSTEGLTEVVRLTSSAWDLIIVHSRGESTWGREDSYLVFASSGLGGTGGILLSVSCDARECDASRNEGERRTRIELADKTGAEFVTPSRCVVRACFEADISDGLEEDMGCTGAFRVSSVSELSCNGGPLVRITSEQKYCANVGLTCPPPRDRWPSSLSD